MTNHKVSKAIHSALVTGASGLLGNNLVRLLVSRGVQVKALVRSREKAEKQLAGLPLEIVVGEMTKVEGFVEQLRGVDVIFHTAAYFRDNYKGGRHWKDLFATNVLGTARLFTEAYEAGVRRIVHTSSVAVLSGVPGQLIDESMRRNPQDADDYYRSKILADRKVDAFLEAHPEMWASIVLPGWMVGPGDAGPTPSGQLILDFLNRRLPARQGRRGERYLAAGAHVPMAELFQKLEQISGVRAPRWNVPAPFMYLLGVANEIWAGIAKRPALISLATVRLMAQERDRTHFNHEKSERELGIRFRPVEETLGDTIGWYRQNGWLETPAGKENPQRPQPRPAHP